MSSLLLLVISAAVTAPTFKGILANGLRRSADQFSQNTPVPPLTDKVIDIPFTNGEARYPAVDTSAIFTYDGKYLTLSFTPESMSDVASSSYPKPLTYWREAVVFSRLTRTGSYLRQTAFGVKSHVTKFNLRTIAIAYGSSRNDSRPDGQKIVLQLNPVEAKALAALAVVRIELPNRDAMSNDAQCIHTFIEAETRHPQEVDALRCVSTVPVLSIKIVRRDTGEVLSSLP
ncbi:MAG: hypothetical protein ABI673_03530 [Novosphingobium sp.]